MGATIPLTFKGDTYLSMLKADCETRQFYGELFFEVFQKTNSLFAHVDLIGIEQYTGNNEEIKHIIFKEKIHCEKVEDIINPRQFFHESNRINIESNYSKINHYTFSTVLMLESYLATSKKASSKDGFINSRNFCIVRARKPQQKSEPIHLSYKPDIQDFHPQVDLQIDKNQFKIGESLRGLLAVDNTNANSQLIRNALTLIQVVELMDKGSKQYTQLAPNIVSEQQFDTMGNEQKSSQLMSTYMNNFRMLGLMMENFIKQNIFLMQRWVGQMKESLLCKKRYLLQMIFDQKKLLKISISFLLPNFFFTIIHCYLLSFLIFQLSLSHSILLIKYTL